MRVLLPVLALLIVITAVGGLVLVSAEIRTWLARRDTAHVEQAKQDAIRNARWEEYADPAKGGLVQIGVRQVARWDNQEMILMDDYVASVDPKDTDRRTAAMATAIDRRDFYNGLLPPSGGGD